MQEKFETHYTILGVNRNATLKDIRVAHNKHKAKVDADKAFDVLINETKKAAYDEALDLLTQVSQPNYYAKLTEHI